MQLRVHEPRYELLGSIALLYDAMTRYDITAARQRVTAIESSNEAIIKQLRLHAELIQALPNSEIGITAIHVSALTAWLVFDSRRNFNLGDVRSAVASAYRGLEALAQLRCLEYGIGISERTAKGFLGLADRWQKLSENGDAVARSVNAAKIIDLTTTRNRSVYAHGFRAMTRNDADRLVSALEIAVNDANDSRVRAFFGGSSLLSAREILR
jgi:hypothetical protein